MTEMNAEDTEKLIAKAIENHEEKRAKIGWIIGDSTPITLGLVVTLVGFIVAAILYGQSLNSKIQENSDNLRKDMLIEIEKRFVQVQDYAAMTGNINAMKSSQDEMKADIKEIKEKLDAVRIKRY